jgi:enoyl-CoA hydratase/carnithine racemase
VPVDVEQREAVALVTVNRPEALNALDLEHAQELGPCSSGSPRTVPPGWSC